MAAPTAAPPMVASEIGRVNHPPFAKFFEQIARSAISTTVQTNIFTHDKDFWIALHFFALSFNQRLGIS